MKKVNKYKTHNNKGIDQIKKVNKYKTHNNKGIDQIKKGKYKII